MPPNAPSIAPHPPGSRRLHCSRIAVLLAVILAMCYLAAALWRPTMLVLFAAIATGASCATVLGHRPSSQLHALLTAVTTWLVVGLAGALWLGGQPVAGLLWVVLVLFLLPLPLIPLLYRRTFRAPGNRP